MVYVFSNNQLNLNGLELMDIKVTYAKKISNEKILSDNIEEFNVEIHNYINLLDLVYLSGYESRFLKDNFFNKEDFYKMYKTWIDKNLKDDHVLIYESAGKLSGFVSYSSNKDSSDINLIAVAKSFHGKGIGKILMQSAENNLKVNSILKVPTQASNSGACRFYESYGFKEENKIYIYHYEPSTFQ